MGQLSFPPKYLNLSSEQNPWKKGNIKVVYVTVSQATDFLIWYVIILLTAS